MEIQELDFDGRQSLSALHVFGSNLQPVFLEDAIIAPPRNGWRRLKNESMGFQPNIDPAWLSGEDAKMTDIDEELDEEIYENTKKALADLGILNLRDRAITNEELDALAPLIQKVLDLVTPTDEDTEVKKNEKIGYLEQLVNHRLGQDSAAKKLLAKDIKELKASTPIHACAKGKKGGALGKIGHKVAKFWKKHKKAIIITAAVVAVVAAVVVVAATAGGGAAAGAAGAAAAGGAAASDQEKKEKSQPKPNLNPSSPSFPSDAPVNPVISYPFQTFNPYPLPQKMTFGEEGVYQDGQLFSRYDDMLFNPFYKFDNSWVNNWLNSAEKIKTEAFPVIPMPQIQPIHFDRNEPSGKNLNLFAYQSRGDWALNSGYHNQALQDFNTAIQMEPSNPHSYLGRGAANFELGQYDACMSDYNHYTSLAPKKEFSTADFSIGFAKGLPKGVYDSGEGMLLFLTDLATHPIQTGSQVYDSVSTLSSLVKAGEWETIGSALSPEVHELVTQWETLDDRKKGELAGYAFGKHGADILLPGASAKILKSSGAVNKLGAVCKNLEVAEKVFVLEAVAAGSKAGKDVGAVIATAERILNAGEDLGLTAKQMAELKQAGQLEQVVGKGRDYFAGNPELQICFDKLEKAQKGLKPHKNTPLPEEQVRNVIHQYDMPTFTRPQGIPDNYLVMVSDKGAGMKYVNPINPQMEVRVMPGKPHSPNPHQQKPYVVQMKNGKAFDKFGNMVSKEAPEAHIPYDEFIYRE